MKAAYINLEAAADRRASLETRFVGVPHEGWELVRFPAVAASEAAALPGRISPPQKGCFESHRRLIHAELGDAEPLLVLEDDAALSRATFPVLSAMLRGAGDWDIMFGDVGLFDAAAMVSLARNREALKREKRFVTIQLRGLHWSGSTAYLVRGSSKAKVHDVLSAPGAMDLPLDIYLRQRCDAGDLNIMSCFPFVTSIAAEADASQISQGRRPLDLQAIDAFRRLMYVERDLPACRAAAAGIRADTAEIGQIIGDIIGAMAQPI